MTKHGPKPRKYVSNFEEMFSCFTRITNGIVEAVTGIDLMFDTSEVGDLT